MTGPGVVSRVVGRRVAKQVTRHLVTIQACDRKHSRPPEEGGYGWVARCSLCGDLDECCSERRYLDSTTSESHQFDLLGDLAQAIANVPRVRAIITHGFPA